jgi:hypothetical protein
MQNLALVRRRSFAPSRALRAPMCTLALALAGCNSLDEPLDTEAGFRLVPTDERPALAAAEPPAPLNGGTLLVTRDGGRALVVDEARDRLSVVDLTARQRLGEVAFSPGSEPGRAALGDDGSVYVVLRRKGSVAKVSPDTLSLLQEFPVCAAPRGLAFDSAAGAVHVACASGRFVSLTPTGQVLRSSQLPNDLRDVVVENGNVWVSRFRSAEVLRLDAAGGVAERLRPAAEIRQRFDATFTTIEALFEPNVGYRLVADPAGGVALLHQTSTTEPISLDPAEAGGTAYGSGDSCNGIVRTLVTRFQPGGVVVSSADIGVSLPLDMAMPVKGRTLVLGAGQRDSGAPVSTFVSGAGQAPSLAALVPSFSAGGPVVELDVEQSGDPSIGGCATQPATIVARAEPVTEPEQYFVAVAAVPGASGRHLVQTREPAQLLINDARSSTAIALGGDSVADTGFDLFHRNAEAGLSCASCHPAGTEDGHVWTFEGHGERRTQPLDVQLGGTAPFHWDGSVPDVAELMSQVYVERMGGVHQSSERREALERWMFALSPPLAEAPRDATMAARGQRVFESFEVGCVDCHRGAAFTDNNSYDVGTGDPGEKFQVPSLLGLSARSRFIHDGCAETLAERFDPACGGDRHGRVSELAPEQLNDLIAFLETL